MDWETNAKECARRCAQGKLPFEYDAEKREKDGRPSRRGVHRGDAAAVWCRHGAIDEVLLAKTIVDEMVDGAAALLSKTQAVVGAAGAL